MKEEKIIMYEAPECAREVIMSHNGTEISKGYLSIDNHFFNEEKSARYQSCTHKVCECGNPMKKYYTKCERCQEKSSGSKYSRKEFKEWDGETLLVLHGGDQYFQDACEIEEYCDENNLRGCDLQLMICEPNHLSEVKDDFWQDDAWPEDSDGELPKEVADALLYLNAAIEFSKPISWGEGKYRTSYEYDQGESDEE